MRSHVGRLSQALLFGGMALSLGGPASAVTIDWAPVGNPGNASDFEGFGDVAYDYQISKYEVTNAQYAEFLNAVASTDTNFLYSSNMGDPAPNQFGRGGISRSGSSGSYIYCAIAGREDMPVNWVSDHDAFRFANWMHNGQPTGAQDSTATEDGAYTFSNQTTVGARNGEATVFLPSLDEWYKAAYYDALTTSYFAYPAGSDAQTTCATPTATANSANCASVVGDLTDVGSYTGSASPYGTFDQGGNIWEWNESINAPTNRGLAGGHFDNPANLLAASHADAATSQGAEFYYVGFRVASLPEPGRDLLVMAGLLGLACRRKRHS